MGTIIDDDNYIPQGWQCPICKRVYSPTTLMCMYCGEGEYKTIATSNGIIDSYQKQETKDATN